MRTFIILAATGLLGGCSMAPSTNLAMPDSASEVAPLYDQPATSLFASDAAVLSDSDIQRILDYRYRPPATSRVAVLALGGERYRHWSSDLAELDGRSRQRLLHGLSATASVKTAQFLPNLLVPEKRTVAYLREAAARYQADLLLLYQTHCQNFQRYRMFAPSESRASCSVEAALIDTRTGLVPFAHVASHRFDVVRERSDKDFAETVLRAQIEAIGQGLDDLVVALGGYLESGKQPQSN